MERALIKTFLMFILSLTLAFPAVAQQPEDAMAQSNGGLSGPRKQLSIIIFSGLAGAALYVVKVAPPIIPIAAPMAILDSFSCGLP